MLQNLQDNRMAPQAEVEEEEDQFASLLRRLPEANPNRVAEEAPPPPAPTTPTPEAPAKQEEDPFARLLSKLDSPESKPQEKSGFFHEVGGVGKSLLRGTGQIAQGIWELAETLTPGRADAENPTVFARDSGGYYRRANNFFRKAADDAAEFSSRFETTKKNQEFYGQYIDVERRSERRIGEKKNFVDMIGSGLFGLFYERVIDDAEAFARTAVDDPEGAAIFLANGLAETSPSLAISIATGIVTAPAKIGIKIAAMWTTGAALEGGGALVDLRTDPETGERRTSTLGQEAIAIGGGIAAGSIEAIGTGALLHSMKGIAARSSMSDAAQDTFLRVVGRGMKEFVKSGVSEGTTETIQDIILDAAAKVGWDPEREIGENWFSTFAVAFVAGGGGSVITGTGLRNLAAQGLIDRLSPIDQVVEQQKREMIQDGSLTPQDTGTVNQEKFEVQRVRKHESTELTALGFPQSAIENMTTEQRQEAITAQERFNAKESDFSITDRDLEAAKTAVNEVSKMPEGADKNRLKKELNQSLKEMGIGDQVRKELRQDLNKKAQDAEGRTIYTAEAFMQLEHEGMSPIDRQAAGLNDIQVPAEVANLPVVGILGYGLDFLALELSGGAVLKLAKPGRGVLPQNAGRRAFDMPIIAQGQGWHMQPMAQMKTTRAQRDALAMQIRGEGFQIVDGGQTQVGLVDIEIDGQIVKRPVLIDYGAVEVDPNAPTKPPTPGPTEQAHLEATGVPLPPIPERGKVPYNPLLAESIEQIISGETEVGSSDLTALGFTIETLNQLRSTLNLDRTNPQATKGWPVTLANAIERRLHQNAELRAQTVIDGNLAVDDETLGGFILRLSEVTVQYEQYQAATEIALQEGNGIDAAMYQKQADHHKDAADVLIYTIQTSLTTSGRTLALGRMVLDAHRYTESGAIDAYRKVTGTEPNAAAQADLKKSVETIKEAQQAVVTAQQKNEAAIDEEVKAAAQQVLAEQKKVVEDSAKLSKERQEILSKLAKLGFRLHSLIGVSPDAIWQLSRLAVSYIKGGAHTLDQVVSQMRDTIPSLTESDVYEILTAQNPKVKKRTVSEDVSTIRSLKTQATLMMKLEKAAQGLFESKKPRKPTDPKIKALRDQLRKLEKEARKSETDLKKLDDIVHKIRELEATLELDQIPVINLQQAKDRLSDLRSTMRVEEKYQDIYSKIVRGDLTPDPTKPRRPKSLELQRAELKLAMAKRELEALIEAAKPLTYKDFRKLGDTRVAATIHSFQQLAPELNSFMRTMMATADISFLGLQMFYLAASHPIEFSKAGVKGIAAAFSAEASFQINMDLRDPSNPTAAMMMRDGLDLTSSEAGPISQREEIFMSRILQRLPKPARVAMGVWVGATVAGPVGAAIGAGAGYVMPAVARASDRAFVTSSNLLRAGLYAQMAKQIPGDTVALQAYAKYLNEMTGRAKMNSATARALSQVFFAPRFSYSMYKSPFTAIGIYAKQPKLRRALARDLGAFLSLGTVVLSLAAMAGLEVGDDPRDSDFGKIVYGNTRVDMWSGRAQVFRTLMRGMVAFSDNRGWFGADELPEHHKRIDLFRFFADVLIYKSAPLISLGATGLTGRNVVGEEMDFNYAAARNFIPLFAQDMMDSYQYGMDQTILSGLAFTGVRAGAYGGPLQSGDVKPVLRRNGFQPRHPDYPDRIKDDKDRQQYFKDMYEDKFAMRVRANRAVLDALPKERQQAYLRYYAAISRYEVSSAMGHVPDRYPVFEP